MKIRFVRGGWFYHTNPEQLNKAISDVFNGKNAPCVICVYDGRDNGAMVVSGGIINQKEAQKIYDRYVGRPLNIDHLENLLEIEWPPVT